MTKESPIKVMVKTSITFNPCLTGELTQCQMPGQLALLKTEASPETLTEASKVKPQRENDK